MTVTREILLRNLPPYKGRKKLITEDQSTGDIIAEIMRTHKAYATDYDKISSFFWRGSAIKTARFIFNFLKNNIRYSIEPDTRQSVKSPAAILATGIYKNGFNDCKHYSLFSGGVLDSLKRQGKPVDWNYRFANYKTFTRTPGHVFVVLHDKGNEFWIDPVLDYFNEKKPYVNAINKTPMALYGISGIGNKYGFVVSDEQPSVKYNGVIVSPQGIGKKKRAPGGEKKKGKFKKAILKVSGAASRNAFLGMVGINLFGLANKLYNAIKRDEARLKNKWENLGGNYKKLKNTILKGYKKQAKKRGIDVSKDLATANNKVSGQVGAVQFAALAAVAAALPILTALKEFVGSFKKNKDGKIVPADDSTAALETAKANTINTLETAAQNASTGQTVNVTHTERENTGMTTARVPVSIDRETNEYTMREPVKGEKSSSGIDKKYLMYGGIAAAGLIAAIALTRNK